MVEEKEKTEKRMVEVCQPFYEILEDIRKGYKESLGLDISFKQATFILVNKLIKGKIDFKYP